MWRLRQFILLGAALFLLGCANDDVTPTAVATPRAAGEVVIVLDGVMEEGYWTGGEWPDLPVYSLQLGISQKAHEHFEACGAGDRDVEALVRYHLERASRALTLSSRMVIQTGEPDATPTFSRIMDIERLVPGVYMVRCERE